MGESGKEEEDSSDKPLPWLVGLTNSWTPPSHCPKPSVSPHLRRGKSIRGSCGETVSKGGREPRGPVIEHLIMTMLPSLSTPIMLSTTLPRHCHFRVLIFMADSGLAVCPYGNHLLFQHLTLLICKADFYSTQCMGLCEVAA